jgi:hypothetical protein
MDRAFNTGGRWPKIYWTGPGSKIDGLHTKKEFLEIMPKMYPEHVYRRMRGDRFIPPGRFKLNDIDGWMTFANARWLRV